MEPLLDHGLDQTAEPWSNKNRWSLSGSNWTIVRTNGPITGSSGRILSWPEKKKKEKQCHKTKWAAVAHGEKRRPNFSLIIIIIIIILIAATKWICPLIFFPFIQTVEGYQFFSTFAYCNVKPKLTCSNVYNVTRMWTLLWALVRTFRHEKALRALSFVKVSLLLRMNIINSLTIL